jgi:hypothetical protein
MRATAADDKTGLRWGGTRGGMDDRQAAPPLPVGRVRELLAAGDLNNAQLHDPHILVVDLPEEVEESRLTAADAGFDRQQLARHVGPLGLARGGSTSRLDHRHDRFDSTQGVGESIKLMPAGDYRTFLFTGIVACCLFLVISCAGSGTYWLSADLRLGEQYVKTTTQCLLGSPNLLRPLGAFKACRVSEGAARSS